MMQFEHSIIKISKNDDIHMTADDESNGHIQSNGLDDSGTICNDSLPDIGLEMYPTTWMNSKLGSNGLTVNIH